MLTVKHITLGGAEVIYPAYSVEFRPVGYEGEDCCSSNPPTKKRLLAFTEDRFVVAELDGGTVFVMNEYGKTVSRYDLGASMVPLGNIAPSGRITA